MSISDLPTIDIHAHYGKHHRPENKWLTRFCSRDAQGVSDQARLSNIAITVVWPLSGLTPRGHVDAAAGNREAEQCLPPISNLRQWVIVDPTNPKTCEQADRLLHQPHCVGIKIHPEEHGYSIKEHGRAVFEFAAKYYAVVLTHSGEKNSLPMDIIHFANDYPQVQLILAHLSCGYDGDLSHQVRAIVMSRHGNVFADTFSAKSFIPNLVEWVVSEIGAEKFLFGRDSLLYSVPLQRIRIDKADLADSQKKQILRDNALGLLELILETMSDARRTSTDSY